MACVVVSQDLAQADRDATARAIVSHCLERLAYYKAPGYVAFCDRLPLTATEKVQRTGLKELAQAKLAAGECIDTRDMKRSGG